MVMPTFRVLIVATLAMLFAGLCPNDPNAFAAGRIVTITGDTRGKTIELSVGDTLIISLESNPGTGYSWQVAKNDAAILKYVDQSEFPPTRPMPGAPNHHLFKFKAIGAGNDSFELEFLRPLEKGVAPAKTFSVTIAVK